VRLPLSKSGTFPVLRIPKISVRDLDVSSVSLTGASIGLQAGITNPNAFSLGASDLGYELKLGDLAIGGLKVSTAKTVRPGATEAISLRGEVSGARLVAQLLKGDALGKASILAVGEIKTPYGSVRLPARD
jgi:LEA14-like dessication related protein